MSNATPPPANPDPAPHPSAATANPPAAQIRLQRVLVPVDFSAPAAKALEYARAFAAQFQARLLLLHVVELSYVGTGLGEMEAPLLEAELRQNAAQQLERLLAGLGTDGAALRTELRLGRPWQEICAAAKEQQVDLIVLGTHGYTGLKHVVLGSTAERVVRYAPCPVLVVREREHEFVRPEAAG